MQLLYARGKICYRFPLVTFLKLFSPVGVTLLCVFERSLLLGIISASSARPVIGSARLVATCDRGLVLCLCPDVLCTVAGHVGGSESSDCQRSL